MGVYLPGSVTVTGTKIYSIWHPAAILNNSFIHKIFIFHETKIKYDNNLPIQVLNDLNFANLINYFKE